jgi:hypothetical protein
VSLIARDNPHRRALGRGRSDRRRQVARSRGASCARRRHARRALARLHDAEELLAVSLKAEHTDVAVAALERVGDTDGLSAIAQRGATRWRRARARCACGRSKRP